VKTTINLTMTYSPIQPPSPLTKVDLRRWMKLQLAQLTQETLARGSTQLLTTLTANTNHWCPEGSTVAMFGGIAGEPDLLSLFPWLAACGSRAAFFAMEEGQLVPHLVKDASQLERGPFGVWVPRVAACQRLPASELTVILTPGLAFGRTDKQRLGRGRGFYDKLFARPEVTARRIGIGFECQLIDNVPSESHDTAMHEIWVA
jgi:5-formyltetrahydrofolate cyclo-ligase